MKKLITLFSCMFVLNCFAQQTQTKTEATEEIKIFERVEVEASFEGGAAGWRNFLMKNLNINSISKNIIIPKNQKEFKETVVLRFIVSTDGSISTITVEKGTNQHCIKEAIRVLKKSPNWVPAMQNGIAVNAYKVQPISFVITQ
jgi:periplasmic protein TonB